MASRIDSKRWNLGRNRLVFGGLLLLLGFMFVALLAPGAVTLKHEEEALAVEPTFRPMRSFKMPLLPPRDFSTGAVRELVDLETLFQSDQQRGHDSQRESGFESVQDDVIVLAEVAETAEGEDAVEPVADDLLTVNLTPLWDPAVFDIVSFPLLGSNLGFTQFDDFVGPTIALEAPQAPAVPEPTTGALLGLGVALLAMRSRH